MRRIALAAVLLALAASAGCDADETRVTVDEARTTTVTGGQPVDGTTSGAVTVPAGTPLLVDFGDVNNSIGDDWFLVGPPDPAILTDEGDEYDPECDRAGCGAHMWWRFGAVARGMTELTFQYCYRSRPPDCEPMPDRGPADPVRLTVTVA